MLPLPYRILVLCLFYFLTLVSFFNLVRLEGLDPNLIIIYSSIRNNKKRLYERFLSNVRPRQKVPCWVTDHYNIFDKQHIYELLVNSFVSSRMEDVAILLNAYKFDLWLYVILFYKNVVITYCYFSKKWLSYFSVDIKHSNASGIMTLWFQICTAHKTYNNIDNNYRFAHYKHHD